MSIVTRIGGALAVCAAGLASCALEETRDLGDYCPDDPMLRYCPEGDCDGEYPCVAYCLERYSDFEGVPETGMGEWCDAASMPDYATWCPGHPSVDGCEAYCETHDCDTGGADGDGDADGDGADGGDADGGDADADGDEETDADHDEPPRFCEDSRDCDAANRPRCYEGLCVPCVGDADCAHIDGLPACVEGTCRECSTTQLGECVGARTFCDPTLYQCVECLADSDCPLATAPHCDAAGTCGPCESDASCAHIPGLPACDGGVCQLCDAENATACPAPTPLCDVAHRRCVACLANGQCPTPAASRCDTGPGVCTPCASDPDCSHIPGHPACDGGTCYECDATNATLCTGATPYCETHDHECVACLTNAHCPSASASRCDAATDSCLGCGADADCAHVAGRPACEAGTCYLCSAGNTDACPADRPECDTIAHACVECLRDADCTPSEPRCYTTSHSCVECLASADCTAATASRCDTTTHGCRSCATDGDCVHVTGRPYCDAGVCRACVDDEDCSMSEICTVDSGCVSACQTCTSDSGCPAGTRCVDDDSLTTTRHCVRYATSCPQPWRFATWIAVPHPCIAPPTTTCLGVIEHGTLCTTAADCGVAGVDDGYCSASRCTYSCRDTAGAIHSEWCPVGYTCSSSSGRCTVP